MTPSESVDVIPGDELLPCPFCGKAMMLRGALWPSDGDTDAIIHSEPTDCPMYGFSDGTADGSISAKWNRRTRNAPIEADDWEARNIGIAVLDWMVKYDLIDGGNEYQVADVMAVMDDLVPVEQPRNAPDTGGTWMPIETAPKDGTGVLVYLPDFCRVREAWFCEETGLWPADDPYDEDGEPCNVGLPTHWMPLPAAPGSAPPAPAASPADGNRPLPFTRDDLGRKVREAWVRWAQSQPAPKASWLVPYDDLPEADKEADRQIGEAVARWTIIGDAARNGSASPACGGEVTNRIVPNGGPVALRDCPIGLFIKGGELCLKTEYGEDDGRIDAYIVSSGEFFWGDPPQTVDSQRRQIVQPVTHALASPEQGGCLQDVVGMSADPESRRVLKLHFNRDVTDEDRQRLCALHNAAASPEQGEVVRKGLEVAVHFMRNCGANIENSYPEVAAALVQIGANHDGK